MDYKNEDFLGWVFEHTDKIAHAAVRKFSMGPFRFL